MVRTEKRPQGARRQVRHDPGGSPEGNNPDGLNRKEATGSPEASQGTTREAAAESGEVSQGTTRKAAVEGASREGPGTVQPGKAPPIGEAHPVKGLPVGAEATGNRQADERRDERNEKT